MTAPAHVRDRSPNRLAKEQSPYLLQHQWNPVDWYPWGSEAFEKARRENKPVFLSIGYSSCHWCHVMERESFESETIAKLLNEKFVSIKVDREERPDVDEIYMRAVQLLTGSGGWPMSVFLTPDQKPFWGGTYFPPDDRGGHPGFASVLAALAETFATRREEVESAADRLASALRQMEGGRQFVASGPLDPAVSGRAVDELAASYDRHYGGFGGAPKFPPHGALELLLHATAASPREDLEAIVRGTLDGMAMGGIRDHVGGGFHRYATDATWLVPHFEKMLYDNAQLASVYAEAFARWGDPEYRSAAEETLAWVTREMTAEEGGFYSALDADSEGGEGAYYLWSLKEITDVLGREVGDLFARVYGIEETGNFVDPVTGEEPGNIVHRKRSWPELARAEEIPVEALRAKMDRARARLLLARLQRPAPGRDDKVVAAWNGLMIGAFARAGRVFGRRDFVDTAARAASFVWTAMRRGGRLLRSWRAGESRLPGYLEDHAFLAWGLLDLHEVSGDGTWLDQARALTDSMIERFWDPDEGGFFFVASDHESLIARTKEVFDQAVPSGNGMAARVLVRLWLMTGDERYEEYAAKMFRVFAGILE
ncbi:MAG: thioredoxin domain-containing protein, partial [Candidatus Eisenbacteria bacterium]